MKIKNQACREEVLIFLTIAIMTLLISFFQGEMEKKFLEREFAKSQNNDRLTGVLEEELERFDIIGDLLK